MSDWKAIVENALGKCADFDPDCPTCQVWAGIADLETQRDAWQQTAAAFAMLRVELDEVKAQLATALEQANGWKAEAMTQNAAIHGAIEAARAEGYADGAQAAGIACGNSIVEYIGETRPDAGPLKLQMMRVRMEKAAKALLPPDNTVQHGYNIPDEKREELRNKLLASYEADNREGGDE